MTRRLRFPLVALALLAGVSLTLAALASWLIYVPSGRVFLAERLGRALSGPDVAIRLEGLDGLPFAPRLARLTVSDAAGVLATAEDLGADLDLSGLLSRPVRVRSFSVQRVEVLRRPADAGTGKSPGRLSLPGRPGVIVEQAAVGRLRLAPDFSGLRAPLDFALTSSLSGRPDADGGRLSLDARETPASGEPRARLTGALEWDTTGRPVLLALDLTDSPEGLAAALAGRPLPGALKATVALGRDASESPSGGALSGPTTLAIDGLGDLAATAGLALTESGGADLSLDGTTSLPARLLADLLGQSTSEALLPERLPFRFTVGLADESVRLRDTRVDARPGSLRAEGDLNLTSGAAKLDLRVEEGRLAPLSGLLGAPAAGGFALSASFQGRIDAPESATASLSLSADPRVGQSAARKLEAAASLRPEASGVAASLTLNVEGLETPETPPAHSLPPLRLAIEAFRPTQDEFPGGLRLDRLELDAPPARLTGVGGMGASDRGWLDLAFHLVDSATDPLKDSSRSSPVANARIDGDFSGKTTKLDFSAELPDLSRLSALPAAAHLSPHLSQEDRDLLFASPSPARVSASAEFPPSARPGGPRTLLLREATLALLGLEATAHGAWNQPFGTQRAEHAATFELDLAVRATDAEATPRLLTLADLPEALRSRLAGGRLTIEARAEGKPDDFAAKAALSMPGAALGVQAQAEATRLPRAPEGQFTARLADSGQTPAPSGNDAPALNAAPVPATGAPSTTSGNGAKPASQSPKVAAKSGAKSGSAAKTPPQSVSKAAPKPAPTIAPKAAPKAAPKVAPAATATQTRTGAVAPVALDISTRFKVKPQAATLLIEDLRAASGENLATGRGAIDLKTGLVDGSLDAALNDLSTPARLLGLSLGGSATLTVTASHAGGPSEARNGSRNDLRNNAQRLKLDATATDLTFPGGAVSRATAAVNVSDVGLPPRGVVTLSATGLQAGPGHFETFTAKGEGSSTPADPFRFRIEGANPAPRASALQTSGELTMRRDQNGEAGELRLSEFAYKGAGPGVRLASPARLSFSPRRADLDAFRLTTQEGGTLDLSGNVTPAAVALRLEAAGLPVSLARNVDLPFSKGRLDASLTLGGAPANPTGQLRASVVELASDDRALAGLPSAALSLNGDLSGGRLRVSGRSEGGLVRTPLVFSGEAPMRLSLWPLRASNLNEPGLALTANGQVDLARLARILPLLNQRMSGLAALNARADGSVANPSLSGTVDLSEGVFEDADNGFAIRNLAGRARLQGRQAIIEGITGTEGDKGRVTAAGWFNIFPDPGPRYSFDLTLTDAHVLRRARLDGTATGAANFTGDFDASIFTAQLTVQPLTIILPDGGNGMDLKGVKLTEVNAPPGQPKVERIPVNKFPINLGMELILPAKAYLKDRNLDSEWKGRLTIGGQDHASKLGGRLDLVRGTYLFVDKKLTLTQGFIEFAGTYPIQAYLEVEAEATIPGGKAFIALVGESTAPMLFLRSEPPLPDDEILSQVLFGKGVANITPWQAVTLARAMRAATGGGRGASIFDIVGNTRKFLGLDELDVRSTETADGVGAALSVGKQISDQVFLRAERGLTPQSGKVTLQVDVSPNLNLESDVGEAGAGIGLNWKYDY